MGSFICCYLYSVKAVAYQLETNKFYNKAVAYQLETNKLCYKINTLFNNKCISVQLVKITYIRQIKL